MSLWSRFTNVFRGDRLSGDIDQEFASHLAEAAAHGRDSAEARGALGRSLHYREASRDFRLFPWLDSLRADAVFGWRSLVKSKTTSAAAILSLALAIGACTSAFRLIDALLLRPLPIANPDRLYSLFMNSIGADGKSRIIDSYEYPMFQQMRAAVKDSTELIAVNYAYPWEVSYGGEEMERARIQYVSGRMFGLFGLRPAMGRLLSEDDDRTPGAHPYAILSHDYWTRRFARDPNVVGRTVRLDHRIFTIAGICEERFTGTETGTVTDVFIPAMMNPAVTNPGTGWVRILVRLNPGAAPEPVLDRLRVPFHAFRTELAKGFAGMSAKRHDAYLAETLMMEPASAGVSRLQRDYRSALLVLGLLVALVLLIACANVGNLRTTQAGARAREMALRVSIGAGQWRLVQLALIESAWIGLLASAAGMVLAWWSAPVIASRISRPDNPVHLSLPMDWRVLAFAAALAVAVTLLFGVVPALRAARVKPGAALAGGRHPQSRRRGMQLPVAFQSAFCVLVLFVAGLFVTTFERLVNRPSGFSAERVLLLDIEASRAETVAIWAQVIDHLRGVPGVEAAAFAEWPLLRGDATIGAISINGGPPSSDLAYFLDVSPGWIESMKIPLLRGRDLAPGDLNPGAAIVNQAFAARYFAGLDPLGRIFEKTERHARLEVVGVVGDARYRNLREPVAPVVYLPFRPKQYATIVVRAASADPLALASTLRSEVPQARPGFRVRNFQTQLELNQSQTVRERLLALLAVFFGAVALLLSAVGLYGVLHYSVLQRQREIGIRLAIGARPGHIARSVTGSTFVMVTAGACSGLAAGLASVRYLESLLYEVKGTDPSMLAVPAILIIALTTLAAVPAVIRARSIDPATMLRSE